MRPSRRWSSYLVLRFGHTFAAHVRGDEQGIGTPLYSPAVLPIFEALSQGMLPNFRGISPHRIPDDVRQVMSDCVARINDLNKAISKQDHRLISLVNKTLFTTRRGELVTGKEIVAKLRTVPGVGPLCAAAWLVQVGDVGRFVHPKQVTAFCGFDPSPMVIAGKVTAHSRRKGHTFLHYMIKQAAKGVLNRHNEPLGLWGHQMTKRHKAGGYSKAVGAVGRRISIAMWVCHRDLVDFSYEKYDFWRAPDVPDVAVHEVGFSPQTLKVLVAHGYATTAQLVNAYTTGELAQRKGVGAKCLAHLNRWITQNRSSGRRASSSEDASFVDASAQSAAKKSRSSPTELCSTTPSSTSTTGDRPRTSNSATRSKSR